MKNEYGEYVKDEIIKAYNNIGYKVQYKIVKCEELGLPQKRHRVIFIATRLDNFNICFPENNGKKGYIKDVITNLDNIKNHYTINHTQLVLERIKQIKRGQCMKDLDINNPYRTKAKFSNAYFRQKEDTQSCTLTNICKTMILHPTENRIFTIREGLRLQGFPDDFEFVEEFDSKGNIRNKQDMYLMVANAIPPVLTYEIGKLIIEELDSLEI